MPPLPTKPAKLFQRIVDSIREIGVLLIAFTPLEVAMAGKDVPDKKNYLTGFLAAGVLLVVLSLIAEWRMTHAD